MDDWTYTYHHIYKMDVQMHIDKHIQKQSTIHPSTTHPPINPSGVAQMGHIIADLWDQASK